MPKIDLTAIPQTNRTGYPSPFDRDVAERWNRRLAPATGLTRMGACHTVLKPGAWSSQRHWHREADELVVMLEGEAVLVEEGSETVLRPGDVAVFPRGIENGHHLQNRSQADCAFIAVSAGDEGDSGAYPDIDLQFAPDGYFHKDGTPYPPKA
jgi:uncharacterized cupin superfamily protein